MSYPNPSSFPQPQLETPMLYYANPSFPPPAPAPAAPGISPPPATVSLPQIPASDQPPAPPPAQTVAPASSSQSAEQMHKNRLQELTQKLSIPLPLYQTINEGFPHAPKFRASVIVDGEKFTSPNTFSTRKAAEKDVAELALKHIYQKKADEISPQDSPQDFSLIQEDTVFCKSILNEFATKMNVEMPTYNTIKAEGLIPVFVSSLVFNGVSYTGTAGKNKKEAEQLAARAVILALIGDSNMGKVLYDIVKSKTKLYAALHKVNNPVSAAPPVTNSTQSSEVVFGKDVAEVSAPIDNAPVTAGSLPPVFNVAANHSVPIGTAQLRHDFSIPKLDGSSEVIKLAAPASQATKLPIEFVHSSSGPAGSSSAKKRRKNKKKANKRLCTSAQLPMADMPLNQSPHCSVAQ